MRHKKTEGHMHSHTLEPYQLGCVSDLAFLKPGTLKPLLGPHTLISSLLRLRWLVCTTSLPLASHCPTFCTPCSQFLPLDPAVAMLLLAPLPLDFNTSPRQPGSCAAALLFATERFKFSAGHQWPRLQAVIYLMNTDSWHLPVAKWVLSVEGRKKSNNH